MRLPNVFYVFLYWLPYGISLQNFGNDGNWFGRGCPPHATGQFPYEGDCKRFYNCFKGRGQLSVCAPGTLFNPNILECDFPSKVVCMKGAGRGPESSRITDDSSYHDRSHRHHHHHQFHHSPEYHSQGYHTGGSSWSPQMQHSQHYHNWHQTHTHHTSSPEPLQRGHYIIKSTAGEATRSYHSGVQPPGVILPMPARELLPPPLESPLDTAPPVENPQPQPEDQSLYSPNFGRSPTAPQQHWGSPTIPESQSRDFDRKFDSVLPRPAVTYNSYGTAERHEGSIVFPESVPQQPAQHVPYYNQPSSGGSYTPSVYSGMGTSYEPSVITAVPPQGSYDVPNYNFGRIPQNPGYLEGNSNAEQPTVPNSTPKQAIEKDVCPKDFSGLLPHSDCTKFMSCSHGRTFVMDCGPGTRFHPNLMICDHPHNVICYSGEKNHDDVDVLSPEESQNPPDSYQVLNRGGLFDNDRGFKTEEVQTTTTTTTESVTDDYQVPDYSDQTFETSKNPSISIKISQDSEAQQTINRGLSNVFRPANITLPKAKLIAKRNSTLDRQLLRLRGSPSQFEGFVEMQLAPGSWGIVCDKHNKWKSEEAHVVCKTLGFPRGAELTWQGLPVEVSNVTSEILAADEVICTGAEESILECTFNVGSGCDPGQDGVWVRCYGHGQSRCESGELSLDGNCYSIVVPDEDAPTEHLVGFTQGEALKYCQTKGGRLLDVTSQLENDFVSEWLLRQNVMGNIMTSGVGTLLMGVPVWIWEGGEGVAFSYHNWWPGWSGVKATPPQLTSGGAHCIVLRRHFPCLENTGGEEKLCDAQYYFWDVEDCTTMSTSQPYVCERPANNVGCVLGTGASYKGGANVTKTGKYCLDWENKQVLAELKYKISETNRQMSLSGHNYCRNVAGKENHPWCFIKDGPSVKKESCDIPLCSKAIEKSARYFQCPPNHYSCGVNGECILSSKVCDGRYDCSNANDETGCGNPQNLLMSPEITILSQFTLHVNMKLTVMELEIIVETPLSKCAQICLERVNCRSFSYYAGDQQCLLSESNIGLSGGLVNTPDWNYYELQSKSLNCQTFTCGNGKCIANETVCNGRNNCGDNTDEDDCSWLKQKIQIRLTGGSKSNEGAIEVKTRDRWGLVCDDEFDMKDGDVICRHLGYPLGAFEIKKHGYFKPNETSSYIIDNLNCTGNESSLADCHHNGWGIHDCGNEEYKNSIDYVTCSKKAAGIICKETKSECNFNYWQCEKSTECIPLGFLCDNVKDCADNSDESPDKCDDGLEVRLVGIGGVSKSNKVTEGRVEVKRFGVWGTVCDDDFGVKEATVVCNSLGFKGPAQAYKEGVFGAGKGVIWLDDVHCLGNETSISDCMADPWGQTNCKHNEDVAVACSHQSLNMPPKEVIKQGQDSPDQNIDEDYEIDDIFMGDCGRVMDDSDIVTSDFAPRVVSGFETVKGSYPWQASIRVKSVSGKSSHWCGAVVVSRFHVITAGHCLRDYIKAAYFVRTGDFDNEVEEGTEQDFEIDEMWIHPDLDKDVRLNNDIAVVKVKGPGIEFGTWVIPACLPSKRNSIFPKNCTISGWGSNSSPGTGFARTLHASWLSPLPTSKCKSPLIYGDSMRDGMFCAGSLEGGPDSCQGDSGGPFLCPQRGQLTLFGITSWGHGCGRSNSPGVYTNVPYYLDWINEKIKISMKNHQRVNSRRMLYD